MYRFSFKGCTRLSEGGAEHVLMPLLIRSVVYVLAVGIVMV